MLRWLKAYHDGRISVGRAGERLGMSVGEVLDALSDLGVEAPLRYDDYLAGLGNLEGSRRAATVAEPRAKYKRRKRSPKR